MGCKQKPVACRGHVHYHGCISHKKWGPGSQVKEWINNLGLNEHGEASDIIIIYPQALGSPEAGVGCWNWGWKGTADDKLFDTRLGVQLATVRNMLNDLG